MIYSDFDILTLSHLYQLCSCSKSCFKAELSQATFSRLRSNPCQVDECALGKIRTPSGTVVTKSVQDIRKFYSPDKTDSGRLSQSFKGSEKALIGHISKPVKRDRNCDNLRLKAKARKLASRSVKRHYTLSNTDQNKSRSNFSFEDWTSESELSVNSDQSEQDNNFREQVQRIEIEEPSKEFLNTLALQLKEKRYENNSASEDRPAINMSVVASPGPTSDQKKTTASVKETLSEMNNILQAGIANTREDLELNQLQNPQTMSVQAVAVMLQKIEANFEQLSTQLSNLEKHEIPQVSEEVLKNVSDRVAADVVKTLQSENIQLKSDVYHLSYKNRTLTKVVDRMAIEMSDLRTRVDKLEMGSSRNAITISGLRVDNRKEYMVREVQDFIERELGVIVTVEECYKMGNAEPCLIKAYLQTAQQKNDVMHFKSYLKGVCYSGRSIFINDYTPIQIQERKHREKAIHTENEERTHPLEICYSKGRMIIQGELYRQKVVPPTPSQLVEISPEELTRILSINIDHSQTLTKEMSLFQAYTATVKTHNKIKDLYVKLKLIQPGARHIVCAYYLEGEQFYHNKDYHDDDELGAGRQILDYLIQNNLINRVVFATRKYGGMRMGAERFVCYMEVVKQVVDQYKS